MLLDTRRLSRKSVTLVDVALPARFCNCVHTCLAPVEIFQVPLPVAGGVAVDPSHLTTIATCW